MFWLLDLAKDILVAVLTGAYTGLVVTRYLTLKTQMTAAKDKLNRLPDLTIRLLKIRIEDDARQACMSLFLTEAGYCKAEGDLRMARLFLELSRAVENNMVLIWRNMEMARANNDGHAITHWIGQVLNVVLGCSAEVDKMRIDWFVVLLGRDLGDKARRCQERAKKFSAYMHGEADDF